MATDRGPRPTQRKFQSRARLRSRLLNCSCTLSSMYSVGDRAWSSLKELLRTEKTRPASSSAGACDDVCVGTSRNAWHQSGRRGHHPGKAARDPTETRFGEYQRCVVAVAAVAVVVVVVAAAFRVFDAAALVLLAIPRAVVYGGNRCLRRHARTAIASGTSAVKGNIFESIFSSIFAKICQYQYLCFKFSIQSFMLRWRPGVETGIHAMPEMMLAQAVRLVCASPFGMQLWSLRRVRRDVALVRLANGRVGDDSASNLDEAEVGVALGSQLFLTDV